MLSRSEMFGLTSGELFVVVFILIAVVSAPYWPRVGERLAAALGGDKPGRDRHDADSEP